MEGVLELKDWLRLRNILVYGITTYFEKLLLGISKPLERKYSRSGLVLDPPVLDSSPPCKNFRVSSECQGTQHILTLLSRCQVLHPAAPGFAAHVENLDEGDRDEPALARTPLFLSLTRMTALCFLPHTLPPKSRRLLRGCWISAAGRTAASALRDTFHLFSFAFFSPSYWA